EGQLLLADGLALLNVLAAVARADQLVGGSRVGAGPRVLVLPGGQCRAQRDHAKPKTKRSSSHDLTSSCCEQAHRRNRGPNLRRAGRSSNEMSDSRANCPAHNCPRTVTRAAMSTA